MEAIKTIMDGLGGENDTLAQLTGAMVKQPLPMLRF